uniref:Ig-like domain-containing protein n=1 Tax=Salarias fasciatus TaxID=181472 RepID=A0A672HFT2_SALFA
MKTKQRDHMLLAAMSLGMNTTLAQKDNVLQPRGEVTADEGHSVTLDCLYNTTSSSNYYLFWYKQEGNKSPKFILTTGSVINNPVPGLEIKVTEKQIHLIISSAAVSDSAVYYCAVRPTVTGNTQPLYKNLTAAH